MISSTIVSSTSVKPFLALEPALDARHELTEAIAGAHMCCIGWDAHWL